MSGPQWLYRLGAMSFAVAALAACSNGTEPAAGNQPAGDEGVTVNEPLVATYDGGLYVLDGQTLEVKRDIPLDGFLRVNAAGDDDHVLVTTSEGFRVLDAAKAQLTDDTFAAAEPGHVVPHGDRTVLFADGSGEITAFDPHDLADGMPLTERFRAPEAHHGVAVMLDDGTLLHSLGDPDTGSGAVAIDGERELARNQDCPGIHGEAVVAGEAVLFGCENGALVYEAGTFTNIASPTPYGHIGTVKGHDDSPVGLGDMKIDADAEMERPEQFSLIDTTTNRLRVVALPPSVSYSFRSLARGPRAEALILGTDGKLYVVDPVSGDTVNAIRVTEKWTEPEDWQDARPTVFARGSTVYVTEPATNQIHLVDLEQGVVSESALLAQTPNELSGAIGDER